MAKVPFTKLKLKINEDSIPLQIGDETIAVKQYLPIQEKLELIGRVVEYAHMEDANYSNPVKAEAIRDVEVVFAYTNISFTDKQKEDIPKLYDTLKSSGVMEQIIKAIPEQEYGSVCCGVWNSIESIYKYMNSVLGLLDTIGSDYSDLDLDITKLQEQLGNIENIGLLKEITNNFG
jgi:hypothetical protein